MTEAAALARSTTLRLHYLTGLIVLVFVAQHLLVHLFALAGSDAHNAALKLVQLGYRNPVVEPLLVLALLFQIGLGLRLAFRRLREPGKSGWAKWQIASGFYLALFLFNHTTAALMTRFVGHLDTNFWWASGPLHHPKMQAVFYPYYGLAVMAVAVHIGAFAHFRGNKLWARIAPVAGALLVLAYWASFGGWLYPVAMKPEYRAYYDWLLAGIGMG
ncbi:MAG: hypothetical protein IPN84_04575 [Sphingomonadales bacterium]|jgi:hypothetical protein|nr:hypothetical protein [Sphingomonadales bacterium]